MKSLSEIYSGMLKRFNKYTKMSIAPGSTADCFFLSISDSIKDVHDEIEKNKNPHLYTSLRGSEIDSLGILVGCQRMEKESDKNYFFRVINSTTANKSSNNIAIELALMNLEYSSIAKHVPLTYGAGTGTIYAIPKKMDEETCKNAIKEIEDRIAHVKSETSYIDVTIPEVKKVTIYAYFNTNGNVEEIKLNISNKVKEYINNIPPSSYLKLGKINSIGINETNVNYFNVAKITINDEENQEIDLLQTFKEKFIFDSIQWIDM